MRAAIDASGCGCDRTPIGADGRPAIGERHAGELIDHSIPDVLRADRRRYAGRRIAVVGSGHSAQSAVRDLAVLAIRHPDMTVTWVVRRAEAAQMFGGKADDQLPERGCLGADAHALVAGGAAELETGFRTDRITSGPDGPSLIGEDGRVLGPLDEVPAAAAVRLVQVRPPAGVAMEMTVMKLGLGLPSKEAAVSATEWGEHAVGGEALGVDGHVGHQATIHGTISTMLVESLYQTYQTALDWPC